MAKKGNTGILIQSKIDVRKKFGVIPISLPTPFPVGPVNVFLVEGDPLTLVDTGLKDEKTYEELSAELRKLGYALGDLEVIIVTHAHRDHMGLLGRLLDETDAVAYGHPLVKRQGLEKDDGGQKRKQFYLDIMTEFGVPDDIIEEANSLYDRFRAFAEPFDLAHVVEDTGDALDYKVHFVPGHSASDTLFVNEQRGFTFVGDHILENTMPNPLLRRPEPGQPRAKSLVEYKDSLHRSRELDLGVCFPGHGDPFDDAGAVVDQILSRQETRSKQVLSLVGKGKHTPFAVSKALFSKLPTNALHLGLSIAVGHLELLETRGVLNSSHEGGILTFHLVS